MGSSKNTRSFDPQSEAESLPSGGLRTTITLLLAIHFFCLLVVFTGLYWPSELQVRLLELFRPYTQTLALDLNYYTHYSPYIIIEHPTNDPFYADHRIEIELDDTAGPREISLPAGGFRGGLAYRRRQTLARYLAGEMEAENASNTLASSILTHYQAQAGDVLRCRRHLPLAPPPSSDSTAARADPDGPAQFETVLEFQVITVDSQGSCEILRAGETGSQAPVDPAPAAEGGRG